MINYESSVVSNYQTAEYGKFVRLDDSTRFPAISVARIQYPDRSEAFPENTNALPVTSYDIYPKFGIISYIANTDDFAVTLSAGQVSLDTALIEGHLENIDPATQAIESNTFDTLTAVTTFNNNFMRSVTALSVTVTNPITAANIKQTVTNWDVLSAAINDSTYTTLPSNPANEITILNHTGVYIFVKNSAKSLGIQISNNTSLDLKLVGNTDEVAIKSNSGDKTVYATFIAYN
jgi:hypothetical protein